MKMIKRLLSVCLSVAMIATMLTVTPVFASENVCHIGDTYYTSLEDAMKAASDEDIIVLDADITISSRLNLYSNNEYNASNYTITDDGNQRTITIANTETSSTFGRGIQIGDGKTLNIKGTSAGNIVLDGTGNKGVGIMVYTGTLNLENATMQNFTNSMSGTKTVYGGAISVGYYGTTNSACANIKNVTFSGNSSTYGADAYVREGATISLDGAITMKSLYLASGTYATPKSTLDSSSYIGIYLPSYAVGTTVLDGDYVSSTYNLFKLPGSTDYSIGADGALKEKAVAKWNGNTYKSLAAAVSDATASGTSSSNRTITLIDDAEVDSRVTIGKTGVVITDDGTPRTIYVYNTGTSSDDGYGRGFQFQMSQESYTLTFKGTSKGKLTIVGHNADETSYNAGELFHIRGGMLYLTNVIIKDVVNSMSGSSTKLGGAVYVALTSSSGRGSVTINNCEISNCQAGDGSAIYSLGGGVSLTNTSIHDCASKGDGGAVSIHNEPGDVSSDLSHNGTLTLNTTVKVYDNYKNTTLDALTSGTISNVSVENGDQIIINANLKNSDIGIDYGNDGDVFANNDSGYSGYSVSTLHRDGNADLKPKRDEDGNMVWASYGYDVTWGDYTTISQTNLGVTTYQYKSATVTADSSGVAVSIAVDNGSFSLDLSSVLSSGITRFEAVKADGGFSSGTIAPVGTDSYKGITLYGTITTTVAASLIKAITFTNTGSNIAQNISFGMAEKLDDGEQYFAGSKYNYVSDKLTWDNANRAITSQNTHLVYIEDKTENDYVTGITDASVWTGAEQRLNAWYWSDGSKFAANATTNEGYNGAFVNWAADQPDGSGESMIINANGQWECKDATITYGYVTEKTDSSKIVNSVSISAPVTTSILSSMNLSFNGDICMYYYFTFADEVTDNYTVVVEVGDSSDSSYYTVSSTVEDMKSLTDSQGNYGIKVPVPAKMMGADIKIRLCNDSGVTVRSYANYDGNHSDKNYNCLYYANYMYAQQEDRYNQYYSEDLISMITAMLNYGAAAQEQFGYDTDNLVNKGHEDTTEVMSEIPSDDIVAYTGTNFSTAELIASSETVMAITYTGTGTEPTVAFNGIKTTNFTYEDKVVKIPVSAQNLGKTCEITIGDDYAILNTNYLLNEILKDSSSTAAQKLTCDRLYKFGKAADQYFGTYEQNTNAVEAVLETAYAYLTKGSGTQYDQNKLDVVPISSEHDWPQGRRQLFASPEDITDYHSIYLDCSSFCFNVYNNVYGAENTLNAFIEDYSNYRQYSNFQTLYLNYAYNDSSLVKKYTFSTPTSWDSTDDMSTYEAEWKAAIEDAEKLMQPGDMITYYGYNSSGNAGGHILMWTGSGFIHCTGSDYDYSSGTDKEEANGSVQYLTTAQFDYTYLKKHGAQRAVILRPLNVLESEEVSDSAIARTQLGSISVESTAEDTTTGVDLYQGQYVNNGDKVEYTITITNKQMSGNLAVAKEVDVVYTPSSKLTDITPSNSGSYEDGVIVWNNVEVGVDGTVKLTFIGTVSGNAGDILDGGSGEITLSDAGSVAKALTFENEEAEIENTFSDFSTKVTYVKNHTSEFVASDCSSTANAMLQYITDDTTKSIGTSDASIADMLKSTSTYGYKPKLTSYWQDNLVSNFLGGRYLYMPSIDDGPFSYTQRVRNIKTTNLKVGDIVMTGILDDTSDLTSLYYVYYVYVGGTDTTADMISITQTYGSTAAPTISTASAATVCEKLNSYALWSIFRLAK